jgi:hypothetical protein
MAFPDPHSDPQAARRLCLSLREIVFHQFGGWKDEDTLHDFEYLCDRTLEQVDDEACRRKLELARRYAAELFSDDAHQKWDCGSVAGADVLRLEIIQLLDALRTRLAASAPAMRPSPTALSRPLPER